MPKQYKLSWTSLIRVTQGAHNTLINLEDIGEKEFTRIRAKYKELAEFYQAQLANGKDDTDTPKV